MDERESRARGQALERYERAMEATEAGHWEWDLLTNEVFHSPRIGELNGVPVSERFASREDWLSRQPFLPGERERQERAIRAAIADPSKRYQIDIRVSPRPGEVRWLRSQGKVFRDETGRPVRMAGTLVDITVEKRVEAALRESESRYARVLEAANEGIWEWNPATDELFASPRARELWGIPEGARIRTRAEMKSRGGFHPDDLPLTESTIRESIARRSGFEMTYRVANLGGETRWIRSRGKVFCGAAGEPELVTGSLTDVTEQKAALDGLRDSEARFRALTQLSSDWYWRQDENFCFTHMSADVREFAQLLPQSSIGKTRWELDGVTPLTSSWEEHRALLASHQSFRDFEFRSITTEGEPRYISVSGAPIFDEEGRFKGYQGVGRNITERKRVEEALRLSEERYALAMQASGVGHWDWKIPTDEYYASARWYELSGFRPDETFSNRTEALARYPFHPDDRPKYVAAVSEHFAGKTPRLDLELRIVVRHQIRWVRFIGMCLRDAGGKPVRWAGSTIDVTDRKRAEEGLLARQELLEVAERQLRRAQRLEAMGTLAGGIAHDFNNILGAILGYGEMALRGVQGGTRLRRDLESIISAGERGRALVDRILAFSRSGVGERVAVHVEKVVREALDVVSGQLPENVRIDASFGAGRAAMLGDPTQIHQVVMNLVTNGVQAMPSGGVLRVSLGLENIKTARLAMIGSLAASEYLVLGVTDTGTGIAPEIMDRIFDPFFSTKEVRVGTGLGLSLVHGLVTEVGGAIDVASNVGHGSTFTVYLPRTGEASDEEPVVESALPQGHRQRVLVVDDEEPLMSLATRTLEELGYEGVGFTSSSAALEAFRAAPDRFDALLTDERMPGLSGTTLIEEVRSIRRAIPILLVSGYVSKDVATRALDSGANEVLKKPLSRRELAHSLARALTPGD